MEMWTAVTEQSKCVTYVNERCVTYVSGLNSTVPVPLFDCYEESEILNTDTLKQEEEWLGASYPYVFWGRGEFG